MTRRCLWKRAGIWMGQSLAGGLLAVGLLAAACNAGGAASTSDKREQVSGQVVEVVGRNIVEVETLKVRSPDGTLWTFTAEGPVEFTPSHLREHQLFGQSVQVFYVRKGDLLVMVKITD